MRVRLTDPQSCFFRLPKRRYPSIQSARTTVTTDLIAKENDVLPQQLQIYRKIAHQLCLEAIVVEVVHIRNMRLDPLRVLRNVEERDMRRIRRAAARARAREYELVPFHEGAGVVLHDAMRESNLLEN
jgi:hypothetical protein